MVTQLHTIDVARPPAAPATNQPVIMGIGNVLMGDDAAGIRVIERLRGQTDAVNLAIIDGGTLSFTLLDFYDRDTPFVAIDAAMLGAQPGTVESFVGEAMDEFIRRTPPNSVHEVSLAELHDMARLAERLPVKRALVAIQPEQSELGVRLSGPVERAIPVALRKITDLLEEWR